MSVRTARSLLLLAALAACGGGGPDLRIPHIFFKSSPLPVPAL